MALGSNMKVTAGSEKKNPKKKEASKKKAVEKITTASSKKVSNSKKKATKTKKVVPKKNVIKTSAKKEPKKAPEIVAEKLLEPTAEVVEVVKEAVETEPIPVSVEPTLIEFKDATLTIVPTRRRKIRKTKVILEGRLSIGNVNNFRSEIDPVFERFDYVDFLLKEVDELDLACIQLLYFFKKYYAKNGKIVTIDAELPIDVKKVVVAAGFQELLFLPKLV